MKLADFLTKEEGDDSRKLPDGRYAATYDPLGRCYNIGCGVTVGVTKDTVWTAQELEAHETAELAGVVAGVAKLVKVPLGENRFTVLQSFAYNVGLGALASSSVLRAVNAGKFDAVPAALRLYVHAKGAVGPVPGLVKRRNDEIRLWNLPDTVAAPPDIKTPKSVPPAIKEPSPMGNASTIPANSAVASNPIVSAAVKAATAPIKSIWSSLTGVLSSVAGGAAATVLTTLAPNLTGEVVGILGILAAIVSVAAHIYALVSGQIATNNATIALAENLLNEIETAFGGKTFTFDNNPSTPAAVS
jgi:GH24 family phage-related lysozyme (muramidase)